MDSTTGKLRTFYTIVLTQTLSMIGSRISGLAIGFWIFAETGQATPLALVAFFTVLPIVLASGVSGVLADRWDRRYVMIIADAGQAIATVMLLISFTSGAFELWHLYVISLVTSIFGVFQAPAFMASVTMLVPEDQLERANAIQQLTQPLAGIIAPAIAGVLYATVGVTGAILVDLFTFLVAMGVIFMVRIPQPEETEEGRALRGSIIKEMLGGFIYLWERKPLLVLVLQFSLVNFLLSGLQALNTPYILARTGSEPTLGLLLSVMSVGGLIGAIIIGMWGGTRPRIHTVMPALIVTGGSLAALGMSQNPLPMGVAMFLIMFPLPMVNTLLISMLQLKVAPDIQGRVFAVLGQISQVLMPVALLMVGPLADQVFEPAVTSTAWETVAPLVGNSAGAGMGLIYVICGVLLVGSTLVIYALPMIRNMEANLPDYVAKEQDTAEQVLVPETELAPGV